MISTVIIVIALLSLIFAKDISRLLLSSKIETDRITIYSTRADSDLAKKFQTVIEKDYVRLSDRIGIEIQEVARLSLTTLNLKMPKTQDKKLTKY